MDIVLVVVRLIHIAAAIVWVGSGFYNVVVLLPALATLGDDFARVMGALGKNRGFAMIFPASAGLTILAGILLYVRPSGGTYFTQTGWIVLSIGALAGIAAGIHGGAFLGRKTGEYIQKLTSGTAAPAELKAMGENLMFHGRISLVLMIIAVIGMDSARYL